MIKLEPLSQIVELHHSILSASLSFPFEFSQRCPYTEGLSSSQEILRLSWERAVSEVLLRRAHRPAVNQVREQINFAGHSGPRS
jgi:hypothetical protein